MPYNMNAMREIRKDKVFIVCVEHIFAIVCYMMYITSERYARKTYRTQPMYVLISVEAS